MPGLFRRPPQPPRRVPTYPPDPRTAYDEAVIAIAGLTGYWSLSDQPVSPAMRAHIGPWGTYVGTPLNGEPALVNDGSPSTQFNGVSQVGDVVGVPQTVTDNWTLMAWIKRPDVTPDDPQAILYVGTDAGGYGVFFGGPGSSESRIVILHGSVAWADSFYTLPDTNAHFVVALRRSGTSELWVDGVQQTLGSNPGAPNVPTNRTSIGAQRNNTDTGWIANRFFAGHIHKPAVYSVALTSTQIGDLWNLGKQPSQSVEMELLSDVPQLFSPLIISTQFIGMQLLANSQSSFSPSIRQSVAADLLADVIGTFGPSVAQRVVSDLISSPPVVSNPTVSPGAVSVVAQLLSQAPTLFDPNIPPPTQLVGMNEIDIVLQIFDPTTSPGAVVVVAQLIVNGNTLFQPTIAMGVSSVGMNLLSNPAILFDPIVSPGAVIIVAQKISQVPVLFSPQVLQSVVAQLINNPATVSDPSVTAVSKVIAQLIASGNLVLDPQVNAGSIIVVGALDQAPAVQSPMVLAGSVVVQVGSLPSLTSLYDPTVVEEQFVLVAIIENPATLHNPRIFLGIVPSNFQWDSTYDLAPTKDAEQTGRDDLKRTH